MDWYGNNVCTFGQKLYFDFAREWDYPYFWDKRLRKDFTVGPRYAYSHVNSLSSAAMAYLATKDESYRNFGDSVCVRDDKWGSCEVSCCSWAVFKLCHYLLMLTGEARFGDWAEKLLYNGCGGQLPITGDGRVMYYADYFINGVFKSVEDGRMHENGCSFEWQCCTGTFPEDVAALCYGPLTLVCDKMTLFEGDIKHPSDWIEPVQKEGYSFAFRTKPGHVKPFAHLTRDFYPYYEVGEREWYYMYNRIEKKE